MKAKDTKVIAALLDAWKREIEAAQLYRLLGELEEDDRRKRLYEKLAQSEEDHARQFSERLVALGEKAPEGSTSPQPQQRLMAKMIGTDAMLRKLEAEEEANAVQFERQAQALESDPDSHTLFLRIEDEEKQHTLLIHSLKQRDEPRTRLEAMLKGEKWHVSTGSWIGDAIYGVNDGLGAVFGVVSGMAGATAGVNTGALSGDRLVLVSGLVALLASALSMGASAYMASKSEREVYEAEIAREKAEIEQSPQHEIEELSLIYQLKGFTEEEANKMAERISENPDQFLKTMVQEELGLSNRSFPNAWKSACSAALSTAIGGLLPVLPFFFMRGNTAVITSAAIGVGAHFAVGAAKSIITSRSWWASGLEMTFIGFLTGGVTYLIGKIFHIG